jgi:aryl-alcohol dehydrogenase-like predicted oxidoreductase
VTQNLICLGTVNFGMKYGLDCTQVQPQEINDLLIFSQSLGIDRIDTARGYGDSEAILGNHAELLKDSSLITKLSVRNLHDVSEVIEQLKDSLKRMNRSKIHCVLLHDTYACLEQAHTLKNFVRSMEHALKEGLIETYGYSIYGIYELEALLKLKLPILNLQVPENVLDRRLKDSDILQNLSENGCIIYVRSLFLQGILANSNWKSKSFFNHELRGFMRIFESLCRDLGLSPSAVVLKYFRSLSWANYAVLGCENVEQLRENHKSINSSELASEVFSSLPQLPPHLVDPRKWNLG